MTIKNQAQWLAGFATIWLAVVVLAWISPARSQTFRSREEIERVLIIDKVSIKDGVVSGEVHNRSPHVVREVQLFIRYTWLWDDEFKPGKADPGTSTYFTLQKEIPAGGRLPFTYTPSPPLPKVAGGHFETSASITGFAEVIPQTKN
jgi:hypothetical protein